MQVKTFGQGKNNNMLKGVCDADGEATGDICLMISNGHYRPVIPRQQIKTMASEVSYGGRAVEMIIGVAFDWTKSAGKLQCSVNRKGCKVSMLSICTVIEVKGVSG